MSSSLFKYFSYMKSLCRFSNLFQKQLKNILLGIFFCFSAQAYSDAMGINLKQILSPNSVTSIQKDVQTDQPSFNVNELGERTLLHDAVESGDVELVQMRIKEGIDVNAQDEEGNTALHYAFFGLNSSYLYSLSNNEFLEIIEILIDAGEMWIFKMKEGIQSYI